MNGLKMAAIYGLRPHALGLCGPKDKETNETLAEFLKGNEALANKAREILMQFITACIYYRLIAKSNGISDLFHDQVVEAYWIGNQLLENVKLKDFKQAFAKDLSRAGALSDQTAQKIAIDIPKGARPHHTQVEILCSIGSPQLMSGKLLDLCRISWGQVTSIGDDSREIVEVTYRPLLPGKWQLSRPETKTLIWNKTIVPNIQKGDWVSFHWNLLCQILTPDQVENLEKYTQKILSVLNSGK